METTNIIGAGNKKLHIVNTTVFCAILFIGGMASLLMKKQEVSEMENRKLASFPAYSDSSFWG